MIRTHTESLKGKSKEDVLDFVKKVMGFSRVMQISIEPEQLVVRRDMADETEPVVPALMSDETLDIKFLLEHVKLDAWPFDPKSHPYMVLAETSNEISKAGYYPSHILVSEHDKEVFAAWLGFESLDSGHVCGLKIVHWDTHEYSEKFVVVGTSSPAGYLTDASMGIAVDMV